MALLQFTSQVMETTWTYHLLSTVKMIIMGDAKFTLPFVHGVMFYLLYWSNQLS